jgi:HAD superfamily hydrolase (TIGR01490 family)
MSQPVCIAFFDMDLTVLGCNTASLWIRRQVRQGHLSAFGALKMAVSIVLYQLGFVNMESAIRGALRKLEGADEVLIHERTRAFFEEEIARQVRPGALSALQTHRSQSHLLVMLTSSSNLLSRLVADRLGFDQVLCNELEVVDGVFTGELAGPLCYGEGKLALASALAQTKQIALSDCFFYTDSFSDVSVMEVVGHPVAVHPDPRLQRRAKKRGWPIVDWDAAPTDAAALS